MNLTSLTIYLTAGWLLTSQGTTYDTWQFWCVMALCWAAEHQGLITGRQQIVDIMVDEYMKEQQQEKEP
jgi:hypothetical protein